MLKSTILTAAAGIVLGACGGTAESNPQSGPEVGRNAPARVAVNNQSTSDMRIYVVASGQEIRLGTVTALRSATFDIPDGIIGGGRDVSFRADPLAGQRTATSYNMFVQPGEQISLTIPPQVR